MNFAPVPPRFGAAYRPKVAVIDDFDKINIDVDGDGRPDRSHGDIVTRLILSQCPTARIVRHNVADVLDFSPQLRECLEQGVDAVNLSLAIDRPASPRIADKKYYLELISNQAGTATAKILKALGEISKKLPVYVSAGNGGQHQMNAFGTPPGVINVGATDARGNIASFSHRHPGVDVYEQGMLAITQVQDGFDLTGDGEPDVMNSQVSGGTPFVASFSQQPLSRVVTGANELAEVGRRVEAGWSMAEIPLLHRRLFKLEDLRTMKLMTKAEYEQNRRLGDYAVMRPPEYGGSRTWHVFSERNGKALYQPDGSNRHDAVNRILGASFSAPLKLGQDMQDRVKAQASA